MLALCRGNAFRAGRLALSQFFKGSGGGFLLGLCFSEGIGLSALALLDLRWRRAIAVCRFFQPFNGFFGTSYHFHAAVIGKNALLFSRLCFGVRCINGFILSLFADLRFKPPLLLVVAKSVGVPALLMLLIARFPRGAITEIIRAILEAVAVSRWTDIVIGSTDGLTSLGTAAGGYIGGQRFIDFPEALYFCFCFLYGLSAPCQLARLAPALPAGTRFHIIVAVIPAGIPFADFCPAGHELSFL